MADEDLGEGILSTALKMAKDLPLAAKVAFSGAGGYLGAKALQKPSSPSKVPSKVTPPTATVSKAPRAPSGYTYVQSASGHKALVHADHAKKFQGLINDIEGTGYKIKDLGGYNVRNIAGSNKPSQHSFGNAIDINHLENPVTYPGQKNYGKTNLPKNIRDIAKKHGLGWGGNWKKKKDTMHFSAHPDEGGSVRESVTEGIISALVKLGKDLAPVAAAGGTAGYMGAKALQKPKAPSVVATAKIASKPANRVDSTWNRMVGQESGGNQFNRSGGTLTSPKGAIGASQIMPQFGAEFAKRAGVEWDEKRARTDKEYNLKLGRAQFNHLVRKYKGDVERAAAAYNAGPGNVAKALDKASRTGSDWRRHLPGETRNYIAKTVMRESVPTKYTREDIINRTVEKYAPRYEEVTPLTLEEQFAEKTQGLSENHVFTLLRLFNDLDESNQLTMLSMVESEQGVRELLDFAIDKYIATQ
jgi:hypothetical protein